jgi:hypothetical protein
MVGAEIDVESIGATGFITCESYDTGNWGYRTAISGRINAIGQIDQSTNI